MADLVDLKTDVTPGVGEGGRLVQLLFDLSHAVGAHLDVEPLLRSFIETLRRRTEAGRGVVTLVNLQNGMIETELTVGVPLAEKSGGRCRLGAEIIDKVIEHGRPAVLTAASRKVVFFDDGEPPSGEGAKGLVEELARWNKPPAFICMPLRNAAGEVLGALGVDRLFMESQRGAGGLDFAGLVGEVTLLGRLARLLAQAVESRRRMRERERRLEREKDLLQNEIKDHFRQSNIVGSSHAFRHIYKSIKQVSSSKVHVLITGEPGVGKELIAEAIHKGSPRAEQPFIRINLASLPEDMIEGELFGTVRNTLTGAFTQGQSLFDAARGGTLFLDEIGNLPMAMQARLLQALQEKESPFPAKGGEDGAGAPADVRIISATSRNLEELVQQFQFRMDLYYRLNLFPIYVPPLRERKSDIPILANHFVARYVRKHGKRIQGISATAMDMMLRYHWPGNIREMESYIEQAVLLSVDGIIYGYHLPPALRTPQQEGGAPQGSLKDSLSALERKIITDVLNSVQGNAVRAAQTLGISERRIRQKMARYQIDPKPFRAAAGR
ncbi:MAG: sigma 54-interacting transcriptional regulator [Acidobacteriota bacterium]|jgi:Nif-specific regulatory protein|nr:sigma 54-interacting transcriptional regulator [Acidobacteriota bacterium]